MILLQKFTILCELMLRMDLAMLKAKNITKYYQKQKVIEGINLEIHKGELVCLLGVSGIGKTTLFQILSGLERPDEGSVYLNNEDVTGVTGKMSYMQQKDLLLPFETIVDNVAIPLTLRGVSKKEARETALSFFIEFGLEGCERKYPSQLSGGMRQRAALLRSYLFSDQVMLLDEPFNSLDVITKAAMQQWFVQIMKKHGTTVLLITHDVDEAILLSDRIYIMSGSPGKITHELSMNGENKDDPEFSTSFRFVEFKKHILKMI